MHDEKVWLVTEVSAGFGPNLIKSLLLNGQRVAAVSGDKETLQVAAGGTRSQNLLALTAEPDDEDSIKKAVERTIARFGKIDIVVNNAGMFGSYYMLKQVIPYLQDRRSGHIINFSSSFTRPMGPGQAGTATAGDCLICTATKLAIESLSEALISEAEAAGVRVTRITEPAIFGGAALGMALIGEQARAIREGRIAFWPRCAGQRLQHQ